MTVREMRKIYGEITGKEWELIVRKGHDYGTEDDRLSNFKRMASYLGMTPTEIILFFLWHKIDRLWNLARSAKVPQNESLADTITDLRNYAFLLYCHLHESHR